MRIKTPAKITPFLRVVGKRPDGFHEVSLALVAVSLFDRIELRLRSEPGIALTVQNGAGLGPASQNLAYRAARAFAKAARISLGLDIHLEKAIPIGAGLGGGSGNAAGMLVALNDMLGAPLGEEPLRRLALALGSDVPFFLAPAPALAEGRGERLTALEGFPPLHLLVVKPPFQISTAEAYRMVKPAPARSVPPMRTLRQVAAALENGFEAPLFAAHAVLGEVRSALLRNGAAGAGLSGSGSALFGLFRDGPTRDEAAANIAKTEDWRVFPCETLSGHSYGDDG